MKTFFKPIVLAIACGLLVASCTKDERNDANQTEQNGSTNQSSNQGSQTAGG